MLSDLRESGSIEQDADKVLMMYRDAYYNDTADPWTEVIVAKNRGGQTGTAKLEFIPNCTLFVDWDDKQIKGKQVQSV
jgi:replicative DNA helicase